MATAELLGNAALGIAALVVIWGALQALGLNIVQWISSKVIGWARALRPCCGVRGVAAG